MFLTDPVSRGTAQNSTSGTVSSNTVTTNAAIPVGRILFLEVLTTFDGDLAASGSTNHHTGVTDPVSSGWTKLGEVSQIHSQGDPTLSLWMKRVTVEMPISTVITVSYDNGIKGRALSLTEFQVEVVEATIEVGVVAVNRSTTTSVSVTATAPGGEEEFTWIAAGGDNADQTDTRTLNASYTTFRAAFGTTGAGGFRSSTIWGQYRQLQTDTQTWSITKQNTTAGLAILAAIRVVPPTPPPAEPGTREVQADFETDTHGVDQTTTDRRPDAVSWDYRTAYTKGPVGLNDVSDGLLSRVWRLRTEPGAIYLARENDAGNGYEDETLVTTYTGADIDEVDFAFTEEGRLVIVAERATGTGGASQVHIRRWNAGTSAYQWDNKGDGRTPRCVSDYFPTTVGPHVCPPDIDVQVFYIKPGTGMVRLEESSNFGTEFPTVLPNSSLTYLQKAFRTTDRRVSVEYGQRNLATGRWQLRRVDSKPYRDSLLTRPSFIDWSSPFRDLRRSANDGFAAGSITTDDWNLRVQTADAVDAIEVQGSATYPSGANPAFADFSDSFAPGGAGIAANGFHDFVIPITSGGGTFSLVAFRARTRKVAGLVTCYSPWRYMVLPASWPLRPSPSDTSVNCDRDIMLDVPYRNNFARHGVVEGVRNTFASARGDAYPTPCSSGTPYDNSDTAPGGAFSLWWFVGGVRNVTASFPFPTHAPVYGIRRRAFEDIDFTDEDGRYAGRVVADQMEGSAGGSPAAFIWPGTRFPAEFPDNTGAWPTPPGIGDIIAGT